MIRWGNGAGGETRTPNRPITNRVLYQLSHASVSRLFSRDSYLVNSSNAKIQAFNRSCDLIPDDCPQVELAMQSHCLTAGQALLSVGLVLPKFILSGFSILSKFVNQC